MTCPTSCGAFDLLRSIERIEMLRAADAAECIAADRNELLLRTECGVKGRRHQYRLIDQPTHAGDPTDLVDCRTDHCEIEPVAAAEIAVHHFADVKREIEVCLG